MSRETAQDCGPRPQVSTEPATFLPHPPCPVGVLRLHLAPAGPVVLLSHFLTHPHASQAKPLNLMPLIPYVFVPNQSLLPETPHPLHLATCHVSFKPGQESLPTSPAAGFLLLQSTVSSRPQCQLNKECSMSCTSWEGHPMWRPQPPPPHPCCPPPVTGGLMPSWPQLGL